MLVCVLMLCRIALCCLGIFVLWDIKIVFYTIWQPFDWLVGYTDPRKGAQDRLHGEHMAAWQGHTRHRYEMGHAASQIRTTDHQRFKQTQRVGAASSAGAGLPPYVPAHKPPRFIPGLNAYAAHSCDIVAADTDALPFFDP